MLDDLKYIHQRDGQDALGVAEKQWQQLVHEFSCAPIDGELTNIVYAGMGGSALAAYLSETWPGHSRPFEVVRQYHIPKYVSASTLFIASSYSGNTEETLSAITEAKAAGARIVVITSGGKLAEQAEQNNYPLLNVPPNFQPRNCALYNLNALVAVLAAAGMVDKAKVVAELAAAADFLKQAIQAWLPTVPETKNPAKQLALELAGKSPVIYGGPLMSPAAYKWKINCNENAKNVAWSNELPEFNHNEMIGWSSHPTEKPYAVVDLVSSFEDPRVLKRFEVTDRLLSGKRPAAHRIEAQGSNVLEHLLWSVAYGDFVTIYLALANGVNPTPVDLVEKFKTELNK